MTSSIYNQIFDYCNTYEISKENMPVATAMYYTTCIHNCIDAYTAKNFPKINKTFVSNCAVLNEIVADDLRAVMTKYPGKFGLLPQEGYIDHMQRKDNDKDPYLKIADPNFKAVIPDLAYNVRLVDLAALKALREEQ